MKHLNWGSLTDDILEILVMNQTQLAKKCRVTQQSVSNWKTGVRNPGVYARHMLRELADKAKLDLNNYNVTGKTVVKGMVGTHPDIPEELLAFAQRLSVLPKNQRQKVIDMAEFLIERG